MMWQFIKKFYKRMLLLSWTSNEGKNFKEVVIIGKRQWGERQLNNLSLGTM